MLRSPLFLSVLLVVLFVGGTYLLLGLLGRRAGGRGGSPSAFGTSSWAGRLPILFLVGAVACLIAALAQFRLTREVDEATVILTMDASQSMNQTDVEPNRLDAAIDAARAFLDQVPEGFRIGLVTFAGSAELRVSPTADRASVSEALGSIETGQGTVIGDGIDAAMDEIEADRAASGAEAGAIVLLSDGRDTGSLVAPEVAADRASSLDIRIYTVVLGRADAGDGAANATLLEQVAARSEGQTFSAESAGELTSVYEELGSRLRTELAISGSAAMFVAIAVALALAAGVSVLFTSRPQY